MTNTRRIPGFCTLCRSRCGSINVVENGRLIAVEPQPTHPTGKALCTKGRAAPELVHSSRRLTQPLKRTRPKTDPDPGWVPVSWDEALGDIAARLDLIRHESGPEAVAFAFSSPSACSISDSLPWLERFVWTFGSPNISWATELCNWHKDHAHEFTVGTGMPVPDYRNADLIVLWGHSPENVWLAQAEAISEGRRRGARLVVIDPRRTGLAAQADLWLQVRPGTDGALALALIRLLIEGERFDAGFVRRWTNAPLLVRGDTGRLLRAADLSAGGSEAFVVWDRAASECRPYDTRQALPDTLVPAVEGKFRIDIAGSSVECRPAFALLREAAAAFTPEHAAAITDLTSAEIIAFAELLAGSRGPAYYGWTGIGQHANATQTDRAIACLFALTGQYDAPGGNRVWPAHPAKAISDYAMLAPARKQKAIGLDKLPLGPPSRGWISGPDLYRAVNDGVPYRIRSLFAFGSNPLVSQPAVTDGQAALEQLEFQVHCDLFLTPSTRTADYVLPVNSAWEREGLRIGFEISHEAQERVQLRPAVIDPIGESRSDLWIAAQLAVRLGFGEVFRNGDIDACYDDILAPLGLDVQTLRKTPEGVRLPLPERERLYAEATDDGVRGFRTPTRRIELYSERLLAHGLPPLPGYEPSSDRDRDDASRYPLVLTTAKSGYFCHGQHRNVAALRRRAPSPRVALAASTAEARGIAEGDGVIIETAAGAVRMMARLDAGLRPDVAVADYGWWEACPDLAAPAYDVSGSASANYNALASAQRRDPASGAPSLRSMRCEVSRAPVSAVLSWTGLRPLVVVDRREATAEIVSLRLAAPDASPLPPMRPGQFLRLAIPGSALADARCYSLTAATGESPDCYEVGIRRWPGGTASEPLTRIPVGGIVHAGAPDGRFLIPTEADFPIVLVAAGIGITPFLRHLEMRAPHGHRTHLFFGLRDGSSHPFRERIAAAATRNDRIRVTTLYSRPRAEDRPDIHYHEAGRVRAELIPDELIRRRARFYFCGPDAMIAEMTAGLLARGVPRFEIFSESFAPPAALHAGDLAPRSVRFARSGKTVEWTPASGSLLDLAERNGLSLPTGCRTGQCESCSVALVEGAVKHPPGLVEQEPGNCLACQAVPLTDLVLDA